MAERGVRYSRFEGAGVAVARVAACLAAALLLAACGDEKISKKEQCGRYSDADGISGWYYTPRSSQPKLLTPWNDALYFNGFDTHDAPGRRLYRYDQGVTTPIESPVGGGFIQAPFVPWRGDLYAFDFNSGLWRIAPDDSVTHVVDVAWDNVWSESSHLTGAWPVVYRDELYFQAITSTGKMELTRFDGASTGIVADLDAGFPGGSYTTDLTVLGESLYFIAIGRDDYELWSYDGERLSLEQTLARDDDNILLHPNTILGKREASLVLWLMAEDALVLHEPGGSVVVDTRVLSAVLAGETIVYTKSDGIYRYDGLTPVFLGSFRAQASRTHQLRLTSGVELGGRLYVTTMEPENRDASWLVEVGAESVTRLLVDTSILEVHEMAVFEEALVLSAADDDGRHHRSADETIVGHELFRFDPALRAVELGDDIRPGWHFICDPVD